MYGIFFAAINSALGFVFKTAVVKFVLFFGLYMVTYAFIGYLSNKLPNVTGLDELFNQIPAGMWFILDVFKFSTGFNMCLSAYVLRFMIRRMPVVG